MVVVEDGVGERRGHVADLLCLSHEVQGAVLDELQDIGCAIRTVEIHVALLLADEGLVAQRLEELPGADEVLHHIDIGACLDVEVAGIEESADVQPGNQFEGLVFRVSCGTLAVQVEVVALRCLQIAFLEGLAVPGAITLGDVHVVHVDGHPHVGGGIGDLVVHMRIDEEVVGLGVAILDVIDTWLLDAREVELHIIIFKVGSPGLDVACEGYLRRTVVLDTHELCCSLYLVLLVELDDGHLGLLGGIAYLRDADIRFTDPARDGIGLYGPGNHLTRLSLRQYTAQHVPAVLGEHTTVVEFQFGIVAADADHPLRGVAGHHDAMACLHRTGIHETVCTSVVVGLETLELTGLFAIGAGDGLTGGIARQASQASVHREGLVPVLRGQELQIEACFPCQFLGHGFIEPHGNLNGLTLGSHHHATVEVIVVVAHRYLDAAFLTIYLTADGLRHKIPLLWGIVQTDGTTLYRAYPVVDDLDTRVLLVVESAVETVAEHQHVDTLALEVFTVVEL